MGPVNRSIDRRLAMMLGAVGAAMAAIFAARIGTRMFLRGARVALRATRFTVLAATFQLYRLCPDCKGRVRYDARVCRHCGHRRRSPPS